jgi:hypothetical protein
MIRQFILFSLLFNLVISQNSVDTTYVKFTNEKIIIDGLDTEPSWKKADLKTDFWQWFPTDTLKAGKQTEIKFLFDDNNIYAYVKCYEDKDEAVISSLRRDMGRYSDFFLFTFDTFNDFTNSYGFGGNSVGVKKDELFSNGARALGRDGNMDWDVKFDLKTKIYKDYYTAEMRIPLSSIRFANNSKMWRYNASRRRIGSNEFSTLFRVPQEQSFVSLSYTKPLVFEKPLGKSKTPIAFIPYINSLKSINYDPKSSLNSFDYGADGKIYIGTGLNLDLTINPDFSQIEVDDQIINLSRFGVKLPEKRQFFIQNSDLFTGFGDQWDNQPFFTRRIGVAKDLDGNTIQNKIDAGLRLSGKLNNRLRIGFLNMQTAQDETNKISANNNSVLSLQQNLFSKSNIKFLFVNRQQTGVNNFDTEQEDYNRLIGFDYNLISKNDKFSGKIWFHNTFSPSINKDSYSTGFGGSYTTRKNKVRFLFSKTAPNFKSDLGFSRRTDYIKNFSSYTRVFYPKSNTLQSIEIGQQLYYVDKPDKNGLVTDKNIETNLNFNFINASQIEIEFSNRYVFLEYDFDPTGVNEKTPIKEGGYNSKEIEIRYSSTSSNKFRFETDINYGGFYNGEKYSLETELNYRVDKLMQASLELGVDKILLPKPQKSVNLFLISPKIDFTFNKEISWATFIQYSNFSDSLGINSRFKWRFAPLSDLYLVYTDNSYFTDYRYAPRFKTINLKITYWLNI